MGNTILKTNFNFSGQTKVYHGKVREVYTINNDLLVMIVSDRISAFDVVMPKGIPYKGQVLNQIAAKFLDATSDIVPNWKIALPDPMVTIGKYCEPFKVEMVIRGYLSGHAWREYKSGKRVICGVSMPDGMKENDKLLYSFSKVRYIEECIYKKKERTRILGGKPEAKEAKEAKVNQTPIKDNIIGCNFSSNTTPIYYYCHRLVFC